jgi:hypothetical protein
MAFPTFCSYFALTKERKCRSLDPNHPDPIDDVPSAVPSAGLITASYAKGSIKA